MKVVEALVVEAAEKVVYSFLLVLNPYSLVSATTYQTRCWGPDVNDELYVSTGR